MYQIYSTVPIGLPKMCKIHHTVLEEGPLATAWQPESERGPGGMDEYASLCDVTYGDIVRHRLSQG